MKRWKTTGLAMGLALAWVPNTIEAQLFVGGPNGEFAEFECFTTSFCNFDEDPISNDISGGGDVWIERDLEVGDRIYARNIRSSDQSDSGRLLDIRSVGSMVFTIDFDNSTGVADQFEWFQDDSVNFTDQLAELEPSGDFEIGGSYSSSVGSFDLAEAFLRGESLEPGDVVRVDPLRSDRVLLANGRAGVIGVASASPAIKMGATVFSVEDLESWSFDLKESFLVQEPALIQEAISRKPELTRLQVALEEARATPKQERPEGEGGPDPDRVLELESMLREVALDLFVERNLVQVALAGRVPVKVDPTTGAIRTGDFLAASERPGLARKATAAGPVLGMALEDLAPGATSVMMLVRNGWYGGEATNLAAVDGHRALVETVAAQEAQILRLESERYSLGARLASLERQMRSIADERTAERRVEAPRSVVASSGSD